jgi:hypothetical protein
MKKNDNDNKQHVEIILVMPLGVDESLFTWGIHFIKDYLDNTCDSITTKVWDFRTDNYFKELKKCYGGSLGRLFLALEPDQVNTFYRVTTNPDVFLDIAALSGDKFFKITGLKKWLYRACARDLRRLQKDVNNHIIETIEGYKKENPDAVRLWAFSVFDNSLFSALHIARLVKENDPASPIVMGNDAFTFQSAEKIMKSISFVDGIALGYGEEIMRTVVSGLQRGIPVGDLRLKGLVNRRYIQDPEEAKFLGVLNIPPFYKDFSNNPPVSLVKQPKTGEIRVYTQRGCKWGKCRFCTQYDKKELFPMPVENLLQRMQTEFQSAGAAVKDEPVFIVIDSYENELDVIARLIKHLDGLDDYGAPIDVMMFLQIKTFRKEFFDTLASIDNKKIRILFRIYIESLNFDTLLNMRKGNSPLQAIEAVKGVQDCGHFVGTNYFTHYPLETRGSVAGEVEILKRVIHLLMPPKGNLSMFPYYANNRDSVCQDQQGSKIKVKRLKRDTWLRDLFGIDLPFAYWAYDYDEKFSFSFDRLLTWSYYKTIKASGAKYRPQWLAKNNWDQVKISPGVRAAYLYRSVKLQAWKCLYYLLTSVGGGKSFRRRTRLFQYLLNVSNSRTASPGAENSVQNRHSVKARMVAGKQGAPVSRFYLEGNRLTKKYNVTGMKENWSLPLGGSELKILRYLYWSRKRKDVIETFKREISETEITGIIDRHIQLGSIVQFRGLLLCVFNDPGYWA